MKNRIKFNLQYPSKKDSLIMAILRCGGNTIKRSLNISIPTAIWNKRSYRCEIPQGEKVRVAREYNRINKRLDEIEKRWSEFVSKNNVEIYDIKTIESIFDNHLSTATKSVIEEDRKINRTPLQFIQEYIDGMTSIVNRGRCISTRTQGHHIVVLKRLKSFMNDMRLPDSFEVFDDSFERRFNSWANKKGYAYNTVVATFSILKVWLNHAKKEKLEVGEAYHSLPSKGSDSDNIALTSEEVEAIYNLDIPKLIEEHKIDAKSSIESTRDLFIIGCWTGLRRADLNRINEAVFDFESNTLTIQTQKTDSRVTIPLHPFVKQLYKKYNGNFPRLIDKGKANAQLRELGRLAGVDSLTLRSTVKGGKTVTERLMKYQRIGFHTARRSFATNLYMMGAPAISIMQMTGHTTEANFLKYIKVSKEEHAAMMQKYFSKVAV
ncbi:site-specific integrase [Bacteroides acidifaciens]|uniref:site-specific integrase n=1 Tax=Bacteroides acidifaciens TaxID=85831 RepID=UPI0025AE2488|nr:site-specific integrase [Bacteroides acidifaciens]